MPETVLDLNAPNPPARRHVVILVHGIRDRALWQNTVRASLREAGFIVEPTNYGRFSLLQFLLPIGFFRKRAVNAVWAQVRIVKREYPDALYSVIAHSFGTFVVSRIIQDFDFNFNRVIFCGSVVPNAFKFEAFERCFAHPIVNEVGTRDKWPAIAESVTWGYGSPGTYGFLRPLVIDRWHNGAYHGYFLNREFATKYWVPFLRDGTFAGGEDSPERPPRWLRFLSALKAKYFVPTISVLVGLILTFVPFSCAPSRVHVEGIGPSKYGTTFYKVDIGAHLGGFVVKYQARFCLLSPAGTQCDPPNAADPIPQYLKSEKTVAVPTDELHCVPMLRNVTSHPEGTLIVNACALPREINGDVKVSVEQYWLKNPSDNRDGQKTIFEGPLSPN